MSIRAAGILVAAALLSACANIPADCGDAAGLADLHCRAALGEKSAQLKLGIAYEEGAGVPMDVRRAAKLYRAAASPTSGTIYVYSPPVGKSPGQVLPLRSGPDQPGLPEAMRRLARLYEQGLGVKKDPARAARLKDQAGS